MREYTKLAFIAALIGVAAIDPAFAQEFGDTATATSFLEWVTGPVALIIVAVAIVIALIVGLIKESLPAFIMAFVGVCIVGAFFSRVLDIAGMIVGT